MTLRDDILAQASARRQLTYRLDPPPDGATTTDCSLLVRDAVRAAGAGELPRTAEAQRQATVPIGFDDVQPGDLLFFEHTYKPDPRFNPPGPDGKTASHVGFSLGAHTLRMLDAHDERSNGAPDVSVTDISTDYWQEKIIEARRLPALVEATDVAKPPADSPSVDPWQWWTAEQAASATNANLAHVQAYWPKIAEQLGLAGIYDRWTAIAAFATVLVETGVRFEPIHEYGTPANWAGYSGGANYAGRGFIQLTHDYNYRSYSAKLDELWGDGAPDLAANPDDALDPDVAAAVLALYFKDHGIPAMAADGNWAGIRKAVNGGMTGWQVFADAVEALKAIPAPSRAPAFDLRAELSAILAHQEDDAALAAELRDLLTRVPA